MNVGLTVDGLCNGLCIGLSLSLSLTCLMTRINGGGVIVVIMQRWRQRRDGP